MGFSRQEYWSGVPLPSPILLICGVKNKPKLIESRNRLVVVLMRLAGGMGMKWVKGVKRYKLPVIK